MSARPWKDFRYWSGDSARDEWGLEVVHPRWIADGTPRGRVYQPMFRHPHPVRDATALLENLTILELRYMLGVLRVIAP